MLDSISVTNLETNETYPRCAADTRNTPCLELSPSLDHLAYEIMNDGFQSSLTPLGSQIRVEGKKGAATFSETYVFRTDSCHVYLESGALTITLE